MCRINNSAILNLIIELQEAIPCSVRIFLTKEGFVIVVSYILSPIYLVFLRLSNILILSVDLFFVFQVSILITIYSDSAGPNSSVNLLPPKKWRMETDWNKCLICQTSNHVGLKEVLGKDLSTFIAAARDRTDDVFERLEADLLGINKQNAVWHRPCYKTYTSKSNVARKSKYQDDILENS